jgi:hypothetical protein
MFGTIGTVSAALLTKPKDFAIFYVICGAFALFAWFLFWCSFDMIEEAAIR